MTRMFAGFQPQLSNLSSGAEQLSHVSARQGWYFGLFQIIKFSISASGIIIVLLPESSFSWKHTLEVDRSIANPAFAIKLLPKMRLDSTLKGFDYRKDGEGENKNCKNYIKAKALPWQLALNTSKGITRALSCSVCGKEG